MIGIGHKIKKLRELKGFKQEYMAVQLEMSQQSYSNIENAKTDVPFSKLVQIAQVLEMKPEELVSQEGEDGKQITNFNFNRIKGNAQNTTIHNSISDEILQLYKDKINLMEQLLFERDAEIKRLKDRLM